MATAVTVRELLRLAYRIQPYQLVGAPEWISAKHYDISAKTDSDAAPPLQDFLKMLLKDRFNLVVHNETRESPVFGLVVARSDGKLGPKLVKSDFDCAAYQAGPHAPPEPGHTPNCATRINIGLLSGKAIPMTRLASGLAPFAGRFVTDKTGLTGSYDVELSWTPEQSEPAPESSPLSIFTALQEQLGLRLVSEKGPVDVLVVDRLEEPTQN